MASYPKQVRDSFSCQVRHGRSKAQMCLQKILNLISSSRARSVPPPETPNHSSFHPQFSKLGAEDDSTSFCANSGFNFDLNIKLGSPLETDQTEDAGSPSTGGGDCEVCEGEKNDSMTLSADVSTMTEKSSVGECDLQEDVENVENFNRGESSRNKDGEEPEVGVEERSAESSEFAKPRVQSSEIEINELSGDTAIETREANNSLPEIRSEDCLHMLIEAAKLISGEFVDDEPEPQQETNKPSDNDETETAKQTKRGHCWTVELCGDTSPVVRSKRGRSQVLPSRYRDSVVEPLNRLSRHQRSTSLSTRRRSR